MRGTNTSRAHVPKKLVLLNEKNEEPESEVKKMATGEDGKAIQIHVVKRSYKDALINSEV